MQQQPLQGINQYALDDVYTPGDSNARRARMAYDYVITDEMLTAYKSKNTGSIDFGVLLWSKLDGSSGDSPSTRAKRPIHILIDADTTEADVFYFSGRLTYDALDPSIMPQWTGGATDKAFVHIYSRGPYSVSNISGGVALHSTMTSCVTLPDDIGSSGYPSGIFRIGVCKVKNNGTYNTYSRPGWPDSGGLTVMYEKCIGGEITWKDSDTSTRPADSTAPGAVCVAWMSGSVDCEIKIDRSWTHQYGLFARLVLALSYGSKPFVKAVHTEGFAIMQLVASVGEYIAFEGNGWRVEVSQTDEIAWGTAKGGSGSGGGGHCVIKNYSLTTGYTSSGLQGTPVFSPFTSVTGYIGDDTRIFRDGGVKFLDVAEDTGHAAGSSYSWNWYFPGSAGDIPNHCFRFRDATILDWYTYGAISVQTTADTPTVNRVEWIYNGCRTLYVNTDDLVDGQIYEVNIHIVRLPVNEYTVNTTNDGSLTACKQAAPGDNPTTPPGYADGSNQFTLQFYNQSLSQPTLQYFGTSKATQGWQNGYYPVFHKITTTPAKSGADHSYPLAELAFARTQFVKLNGNVYVLRY